MLSNLSVVIPYYNGEQTIHKLIMSLPRILPIIIVDDVSDSPLTIEEDKYDNSDIKVVNLVSKRYFSGAVNVGWSYCQTDVLVLNQDTWFENTAWYGIIDQYRDRYAMIGERVKGMHPTFGSLGYSHGTFCFFRRDAIEAVGLLNEKDYPLWGSTAEWQLRAARKGFQVLPLAEIPGFHHDRPKTERYGSSIKTLLSKMPTAQTERFVRTPPLLSVIVLCYNYGRYLQDCINSLVGGPTILGDMPGQSLSSFEVVIVNDASTDDSADIIDDLAKRELGIRAYHLKENVGTAQALNLGISMAVGKYITFLSADDMRESFSLESLVRACEQNPHSFAYDDIWLCYKSQRIKQWEMEEYDFEKLLHANQIHAGIVYPKQAWVDVGGYPAIMNDGREDWAFNVALGIHGWCGVHVKQFGYLYRREGQNRTETNTKGYFKEYFADKIRSVFPKIYEGYRPMACCGKGKNAPRTNQPARMAQTMAAMSTNGGGARMASNIVGSQGMVRIEYLGKQMQSTWDGPATGQSYSFGMDKPRGWVDRRDAGERSKNGFLNMKDRGGNWLFQTVSDNSAAVSQPVPNIAEPIVAVQVTEPAASPAVVAVAEAAGTLSVAEKTLDVPNPTDMNVEEIKRLDLTWDQWAELYRIELANRNRKGAIAFLEEKLANWDSQ